MAFGYRIWDSSNNVIADSSITNFPMECYPGVSEHTAAGDVVYDLENIGTSNVHFTTSSRQFPSGTPNKELVFSNIGFGESYSHSGALTTRSVSFTDAESILRDEYMSGWKNDTKVISQLILLPVANL